jgi:hypothetical protein
VAGDRGPGEWASADGEKHGLRSWYRARRASAVVRAKLGSGAGPDP